MHCPDTLQISFPGTVDPNAPEQLIPLVYGKLRRWAGAYLRDEHNCPTLQPTALVNEAYIRLVRSPGRGWKTNTEFVRLACCVMRKALIDHARRKKAAIRGGTRQRLQLNDNVPGPLSEGAEDLLDLDAALKKLEAVDPRRSKVVEMRYFGGLTVEEIGQTLGISPRTVKSDWNLARAWLRGEMRKEA